MTNCPFDHIDEYDDIQVKNAWKALIGTDSKSSTGGDLNVSDYEGNSLPHNDSPVSAHDFNRGKPAKFLATANRIARDHARTPMQWSDAPDAGFTDGPRTWLKVNPNYPEINVAKQTADAGSVLNYYRNLLHFRKQTPMLHEGTYHDLMSEHPTVWAFERRAGDTVLTVLANVSNRSVAIDVPVQGKVVLSNYPDKVDVLRPFEIVVRVMSVS